MNRMTGPDCAVVMCNLINIHTHIEYIYINANYIQIIVGVGKQRGAHEVLIVNGDTSKGSTHYWIYLEDYWHVLAGSRQ